MKETSTGWMKEIHLSVLCFIVTALWRDKEKEIGSLPKY
jgi:hypothetical protein